MVAMPVVMVQPAVQGGTARGRAGVGAAIGPLAQQRLDEALRLAVGARRVGPGAEMAELGALAGRGEDVGEVAGAVVGHKAADPDAVAAKPGQGAPEKPHARDALLIGQDLDVGQPGGIIDGHVHELPADAAHPAAAIARDAVPDAPDPAELLDVDMYEAAGAAVLVPHHGRGRLEAAQPRQPQPAQIPGDGGRTESQGLGDLGARPALPAQALDELLQRAGRLPGAAVGAAGPVGQGAGLGPTGPCHPLAHGPLADAERRGDLAGGLPRGHDTADNLGSTLGRGPGILVDVHPSLLVWGELASATTSYPLVARMNNLLTLHT